VQMHGVKFYKLQKLIKKYESPKIYYTCEKILKQFYLSHKKIDKTIRIIVLEQDAYPKLINAMKQILHISFHKQKLSREELENLFNSLFYDTYIIQSHLSFLLNHNHITIGFYKQMAIEIESYQA